MKENAHDLRDWIAHRTFMFALCGVFYGPFPDWLVRRNNEIIALQEELDKLVERA